MSSAPEMPRPVETWSLVVRSKTAGKTAKDVVDKVVKEVGPTLGVRVHEVKPLRDGGAIIRTPCVAERKKFAGVLPTLLGSCKH
ncbi:GH12429 [Drosophila grimshawi]|uniref:GH12429 n=1 Tax=Drosophila grimshawi TaxID=7222 RepID=B4JJ40_DROGR|nr:GH12429 [Drosophila grimshawi]